MKKLFKSKGFTTALIIMGLVLVVGMISLLVRMGTSQTYTTLSASDYQVGSLNATGEFEKNAGSFVSKDFYDVDGLSIKVEDDADLSYRIYFYDENKEFISSTNSFAVTYNGTIPENAELFKIVINPMNDDDISTFDIISFSEKVNVRFYK